MGGRGGDCAYAWWIMSCDICVSFLWHCHSKHSTFHIIHAMKSAYQLFSLKAEEHVIGTYRIHLWTSASHKTRKTLNRGNIRRVWEPRCAKRHSDRPTEAAECGTMGMVLPPAPRYILILGILCNRLYAWATVCRERWFIIGCRNHIRVSEITHANAENENGKRSPTKKKRKHSQIREMCPQKRSKLFYGEAHRKLILIFFFGCFEYKFDFLLSLLFLLLWNARRTYQLIGYGSMCQGGGGGREWRGEWRLWIFWFFFHENVCLIFIQKVITN